MMNLQEYPFKHQIISKEFFVTWVSQWMQNSSHNLWCGLKISACVPGIQLLLDLSNSNYFVKEILFLSKNPDNFYLFSTEFSNDHMMIKIIENWIVQWLMTFESKNLCHLKVPKYNHFIKDCHTLIYRILLIVIMHFLLDAWN